MGFFGNLRASARALVPLPLRQAVQTARELVGVSEKVLYHASCASLFGLQARRAIRYHHATADELRRLGRELDYDPRAIEMLLPRLAAGDLLVLGEHEDRVLCAGWISIGAIDLPTVRVPIPRTIGYAYKIFTRPEERGAGLMRGLYGHLARGVVDRGVDTVVATVAIHNEASRRAHERAGFARLGRFWDVHVGPAAIALTDGAVGRCLGTRMRATYG